MRALCAGLYLHHNGTAFPSLVSCLLKPSPLLCGSRNLGFSFVLAEPDITLHRIDAVRVRMNVKGGIPILSREKKLLLEG